MSKLGVIVDSEIVKEGKEYLKITVSTKKCIGCNVVDENSKLV